MALVRVAQYGSVPGPVTDYQAQNAHLQAFTNQLLTQQFILDSGTDQPVIKQGCYVSHGGSLYVADADTSITGSPSDGSVYIRVSGSTSLTVEFINNISGYTWNPVYSALTSGSYTLLPYLIVKASTVWTRYNFNPNNQQFGSLASLAVTGNATVGGTLAVTGAISGDSIDTIDATIDGRSMVLAPHSSGAKEVFTAQVGAIRGLTTYNGDIYEGSSGGVVHRHDGTSETILSSVTLPHGVYALCFIDGDLVAADGNTVYRYSGFSNSLKSSFYTGSYANGLAWDGTDLWIISYSTSAISHYDGFSSTKLESIGLVSILNDFGISRSYNVSGLVWTGKNFIFSIGLNTGSSDWNICALDKTNSYIVDAYNAYTDVGNSHVSGLALLDNFIYFGNFDTSTPQPIHRIPIRMAW